MSAIEGRSTTEPSDKPTLIPGAHAHGAWHALRRDQALAQLRTTEDGLTSPEAQARRRVFGANILPRRKRASLAVIYARQFKNPLVYLLLLATVVSVGMAEWADAFFIFIVIQLNAAIGTYQERQAEGQAAALDVLVRNIAVARRDGVARRVDASDLVPGDIVSLGSGALVPADIRVLSVTELTVDESLLTGESTPVAKDAAAMARDSIPIAERRNMLHAGTTVLSGRVSGVVAVIGSGTEVGQIAAALARGDVAPPPLVTRLERFSRVIGVATLLFIALIAAVQLLQGLPLVQVFLVAVALAVAAIPEGLPVAITVALSIAATRMARRNVIVRALPAVEGLGACTLIASDKTGTLTCNELTVKRVRLFGDAAPPDLVEVGGQGYLPQGGATLNGRALSADIDDLLRGFATSAALCNEASLRVRAHEVEHLGDTVDVALLVFAAKLGLDYRVLQEAHPRLGLLPYEPRRRFGAVFTAGAAPKEHEKAVAVAHVKGAPEVILDMCDGPARAPIQAAAEDMAAAGYRVLAVARGTMSIERALSPEIEALRGLTVLGLVGLIDPVRPEVPAAIDRCRSAGVDVRMVTGDHPSTALAIARELRITGDRTQVVSGSELGDAADDQTVFDSLVGGARVFARIDPVQKLSIVQALQRRGELVAVSGDGVNDAPALSAADIGVAMGESGTDAARGAADLILADDNFASIVSGVEEGRIAYDNVRKLVFLLITTGLGEIVLFLLSIATGLPLPLFAIQLLWLNLVTNGIQDVALSFEKGEPDVLGRMPRPPTEPLFEHRMILQVIVGGTYMGVAAFAFYSWALDSGMSEAAARNLLLLLMVLFENVQALNARSERRSVFRVPLSANPFLILAIFAAQGLHIVAMYTPGFSGVLDVAPIGWRDWLTVAAIAATLLVVMEILKLVTNHTDGHVRRGEPVERVAK